MRLSDAHDRRVSRQTKTCLTEVFEADTKGAARVLPGKAEPRATRPPHKENCPTTVVRMRPKIIQAEIEKNIFHQLNELEPDDRFLVQRIWYVGCLVVLRGANGLPHQFIKERMQFGSLAETFPDSVERLGVLQERFAAAARGSEYVG